MLTLTFGDRNKFPSVTAVEHYGGNMEESLLEMTTDKERIHPGKATFSKVAHALTLWSRDRCSHVTVVLMDPPENTGKIPAAIEL